MAHLSYVTGIEQVDEQIVHATLRTRRTQIPFVASSGRAALDTDEFELHIERLWEYAAALPNPDRTMPSRSLRFGFAC
jgi:hypothetical protein